MDTTSGTPIPSGYIGFQSKSGAVKLHLMTDNDTTIRTLCGRYDYLSDGLLPENSPVGDSPHCKVCEAIDAGTHKPGGTWTP